MTVEELMEELSKQSKDSKVRMVFQDAEGSYYTEDIAEVRESGGVVVLVMEGV